MDIIIENHIPIPSKRRYSEPVALGRMKVGDSFWHPAAAQTMYKRIWQSQQRGNLKGKSFIVRAETREGLKGCRVWREK